ncbi:coronin-2B-like [Nematolebias whitei]|uniref:coronin-2B-like n=1 Tax=Nematolebias whitei TaxID=451745 RepID=UPI0018971BCD|nr:coronin-2B-like [Nematolebias whitei]
MKHLKLPLSSSVTFLILRDTSPRFRPSEDRDVLWTKSSPSCSQVKIWDIPASGVKQNVTRPRKTLIGHSRRVAIIEWHPTAENLLLSSAYDYKVLLWDVSRPEAVIRCPARVVLMPVHHRYPSEALLLSVSFNSDGSRLAVTSKDRRVRVLDPRAGKILQVSNKKTHKANKVLYITGLKMLLSTGSSSWNHRQIVLWDPDDLSEPLFEEDLDGSAGVLFPFYDPDTQMLYLAGKGDGNIRCYELSPEKPYMNFLMEFRSLLPQKGLGVMPKRGLNVSACEVFRFYRLITVKDLVEPLSMIVPRKESGIFQADLYPMTAGNQPALMAQEWLQGINRGPVLMSLKPETQVENPYAKVPAEKTQLKELGSVRFQMSPTARSHFVALKDFLEEQLAYQDAKYPRDLICDLSGWHPDETQFPLWTYCCTPHCCEPAEKPPPTTETELLKAFYRQQDEIRDLREDLLQKDRRLAQLELEIKTSRSNMRATV